MSKAIAELFSEDRETVMRLPFTTAINAEPVLSMLNRCLSG